MKKTSRLSLKKLIKDRKAFLFSILTIMLLLPLFFFASKYLTISKTREGMTSDIYIPDKIVSIENNYRNLLFDALDLEIEQLIINKAGTRLIINNITQLSGSNNIVEDVNDITQFMVDAYSNLSNINITIINSSSSFILFPYGSDFIINDTEIRIITQNYSAISTINITLWGLHNYNWSYGSPNNDGSIYPELNVKINRLDKTTVFDISRTLNPEQYNIPIYEEFNLTTFRANISIYFGQLDGIDGVLLIKANNISTTIESFEIAYKPSTARPNIYSYANLSISTLGGRFRKNSRVLLYSS